MGLRRGEILGLGCSDVDLEQRVLRISNQVQRVGGELSEDTTKSGRARPVPLPLICLAALRGHQISITTDVYTHVASDTQREAISHMDRPLGRRVDRE